MACNAMPRRGPVSIAPIVVQVNCREFLSRYLHGPRWDVGRWDVGRNSLSPQFLSKRKELKGQDGASTTPNSES
jgi:hypothetical protein